MPCAQALCLEKNVFYIEVEVERLMEMNQHTNIDIKASCDTSQLAADQQVVWGGYVLCEDRVGGEG